MLPKVTVIIATYNRAKAYLLEALESVLAQTYGGCQRSSRNCPVEGGDEPSSCGVNVYT
jgi:GT2 family glycosyltransferase